MGTESVLENLIQELKRGTLVIAVLICTRKPGYGYSLVRRLRERGVDIEQNTLYPLLRRLEKQGLLTSVWDTKDSRPRRYYSISTEGKVVLSCLLDEWKKINSAVEEMKQTGEENG